RLGVSISADAVCRSLSIADQQILEIMRALQFGARVILLDEPTAVLAPTERRALFRAMKDLRTSGRSMVFVSHNLDEVLEIADEVSVFRDGRLIDSKPTKEWTKPSIVSAILGRDRVDIYRRRLGKCSGDRPIQLRVTDVSVPGAIAGVNIELHRGEILGI